MFNYCQLFTMSFSCMRRTQCNGITQNIWRRRVKGELANPGLPGRTAVKSAFVCVHL